jgi:uncharacterized membrane protein YgcG
MPARRRSPYDAPVREIVDFSSWQGLLSTVLALVVFSLVVVGVRLLVMHTVQQRRERENRQINERLRTLIAAYKTLGGSFTGDLLVDPTHLRDLHLRAVPDDDGAGRDEGSGPGATTESPGGERRRRVRDAVEAALSDVILLGTEDQVRLAATAAQDMAAGRPIATAELVVSLRTFIREVLGLDPAPAGLVIPRQGPTRTATGGGRNARGDGAGARSGGGGRAGGGGAGAGMGLGLGRGLDDHTPGGGAPG